jgi:hypothetical protein
VVSTSRCPAGCSACHVPATTKGFSPRLGRPSRQDPRLLWRSICHNAGTAENAARPPCSRLARRGEGSTDTRRSRTSRVSLPSGQ